MKISFTATSLLLVAAASLLSPKVTRSTEDTAAIFLTLSPSTRANGMGESLVAVADPALTYFNPAALGIFSLDNIGALGWSHADWMPGFDIEDLWIEQFYANLGYSLRRAQPGKSFNLSLGMQYRSHVINYGTGEGRDENNLPLGTYHAFERNRAIVLGVGFECGFEVGVGASIGQVYSHLQSSARNPVFDYGLMLRAPLIRILQKIGFSEFEDLEKISFNVTPSFGFAHLNEGEGLTYDAPPQGGTLPEGSSLSNPFPTLNRYGLALDFQLKYRSLALLGLLWSRSWTDHLEEEVNGELWNIKGWGLEYNLADVFIYRFGEYSSSEAFTSRDTHGYTIQTLGLTAALNKFYFSQQIRSNQILSYLLTHACFRYHYSNWESGNFILDNTQWIEFQLQF